MADDLILADAYHVLASDEVGVKGGVHTLSSIDDSVHAMTSDDRYIVIPLYDIYTNVLDPPKLPIIKCSAKTGTSANLNKSIPGLQISARSGIRADNTRLPALQIDAEGSHESLMTVAGTFPELRLFTRMGIRGGANLRLSDLRISASAIGGLIATLDKKLPYLTISATAFSTEDLSVSGYLPFLQLSVSMSGETIATLARNLPALTISASMTDNGSMTVSAYLSNLKISATGISGSMLLSQYLPPLLMFSGSMQSSLIYDSDYILRHHRWVG